MFTKEACQMTARQETEKLIEKYPQHEIMLRTKILPILDKLGI
jgi:hypothetical protein